MSNTNIDSQISAAVATYAQTNAELSSNLATTRAQYDNTNTEYSENVEKLTARIAQLQATQTDSSTVKAQNDLLSKQLSVAQLSTAAALSRASAAETSLTIEQSRVLDAQTSITAISSTLAAEQSINTDLDKVLDSASSLATSLETEKSLVTANLGASITSLATNLQIEYSSHQAYTAVAKDIIASTAADHSTQIAQLADELSSAQLSTAAAISRASAAETSLTIEQSRVLDAQASTAAISTALAAEQSINTDLDKVLDSTSSLATSLSTSIASLTSNLEAAQSQAASAELSAANLNNDNLGLSTQIASAQAEISTHVSVIKKQAENIEYKDNANHEWGIRFEEASSEQHRLARLLEECSTNLAATKKQYNNANQEYSENVASLTAKIAQLQAEQTQTNNCLESTTTNNYESNDQASNLHHDYSQHTENNQ